MAACYPKRMTVVFFSFFIIMIGGVCISSSAYSGVGDIGDWTMTVMHPADGLSSKIFAADGIQKVGVKGIDDGQGDVSMAACLWTTDGSECVQFTSIPSTLYAVSSGQQVGYLSQFAVVWSGSPETMHELLSPKEWDAKSSAALAVCNGWQAGQAIELSSNSSHALLWHYPTDDNVIDLHDKDKESESVVNGIYGASADSPGYQVGYAQMLEDGQAHAMLWNGTKEGAVDLHLPTMNESSALAGDGSQQVGYVVAAYDNGNPITQAILWNGAADDFVMLHPAGAYASIARAIEGPYQVGEINRDLAAIPRATLWQGSNTGVVDLHALLPQDYIASWADGIDVTSSGITVVGSAYNEAKHREEAIMWQFKARPSANKTLAGALLLLLN